MSRQLSEKKVIKLLKAEILWHQKHCGMTGCALYESGFVKGLKHAKEVIEKLAIEERHNGSE